MTYHVSSLPRLGGVARLQPARPPLHTGGIVDEKMDIRQSFWYIGQRSMAELPITTIVNTTRAPLDWQTLEEGQLAIDVIDAGDALIVVSPLAGAQREDIEVHIHEDLLTIRGVRPPPISREQGDFLHEECFWGKFSRSIILPVDVKGELGSATYTNGILCIRIPKRQSSTMIPVTIVEE